MSGVTDPAEEYFKNGLWAWVTDQWKKLVGDDDGHLQVDVVTTPADVEIKQTTAADLTPGVMGWDGAAWHKLAMVFGYSDRYSEAESEDDVSAATHYLSFSTVPDGEVWVVTAYTAYCTTANPTSVRLGVIQGGVEIMLAQQKPVTAGLLLAMSGQLILKKDDYLRAGFTSCALNDDIRAFACGYKMKVAE